MSYFYYDSKKIYYTERGEGKPVVFLHGNTASSKMFEPLLPLYADQFHVILMDFLGNGRSDRVAQFSAELWIEGARQTIALLEHLAYGKVSIVGCSGGAWAGVNAGLMRPDLVKKSWRTVLMGELWVRILRKICAKNGKTQRKIPRPPDFINGVRVMTGKRLWIWTRLC